MILSAVKVLRDDSSVSIVGYSKKSNNIDIRAKIVGTGPLIVLVHGCPESWYSWRHQISLLSEKGYTVAAIDVRGYGGSSKPYEVEAYSMRAVSYTHLTLPTKA